MAHAFPRGPDLEHGGGRLDRSILAARRAQCADYVTKSCGATYDQDARCPLWLKFLDRIFDHDASLIGFLRRTFGYTLTGVTHEHALWLLCGGGANGKSVLTATWRALLGDYGTSAAFDTFVVRKGDQGPRNDLAALLGVRFVAASESEEGRRLAEATLKMLTGGDEISARRLYSEFFTFTPTFKLALSGNYRPRIRGTDLGIWRRVRLVPFTVTIPPDEQDPLLAQKLRAELPGILKWAVEGSGSGSVAGFGSRRPSFWRRRPIVPPRTWLVRSWPTAACASQRRVSPPASCTLRFGPGARRTPSRSSALRHSR